MPKGKTAKKAPRRGAARRGAGPAPFEGLRSFIKRTVDERPEIFEHLTNSRIEFWKAVRAVLDRRIGSLERSRGRNRKSGVTKVRVTE